MGGCCVPAEGIRPEKQERMPLAEPVVRKWTEGSIVTFGPSSLAQPPTFTDPYSSISAVFSVVPDPSNPAPDRKRTQSDAI